MRAWHLVCRALFKALFVARKRLSPRSSRLFFGLTALCVVGLLGCNTYNPYLGASPTVSSSITSITPSGAVVGHPDIALMVTGSGFVANSIVTWNSSNSTSVSLFSNVLSSTQMQANIPASFLNTPGTFFVGVIAPGPTSGNNAGNNISNFLPFTVCPAAGCPSVVSSPKPRISALSSDASARLSFPAQMAPRYQTIVADSFDASTDTEIGIARIFLRDSCLSAAVACSPHVIPISVGWNGADPNGSSGSPSVTSDGRFVVFASDASNLVKGDSNGWSDIFLRDTCIDARSVCLPATLRLSVGPDGAEADGASLSPAIDPDGRFVVFNSWATNLVRSDVLNSFPATSNPRLFLRDTCFGATSGCVPTTTRVVPASTVQP